MVSRGDEHAADLMISSFVKGDERFLFADGFESCGQQGFGLAVEDERAGGEELALMSFQRPIKDGVIDFKAMGLRMNDPVQQLAIVC